MNKYFKFIGIENQLIKRIILFLYVILAFLLNQIVQNVQIPFVLFVWFLLIIFFSIIIKTITWLIPYKFPNSGSSNILTTNKTINISIIFSILLALITIRADIYFKKIIEINTEKKELRNEIDTLKGSIDISGIKAKLSQLKVSLREYSTGETDLLVNEINSIDLNSNQNKIYDIYGEDSGIIVECLKNIVARNQIYHKNLDEYIDKETSIKKQISNIESEVRKLKRNGYQYIDVQITRRFDTHKENSRSTVRVKGSEKGAYEGHLTYKGIPIVLYASEKEIEYFRPFSIFVKSLGEKKYKWTSSTPFRGSETRDEWRVTYEAVSSSKDPAIKEKKLVKLVKQYEEIKLENEDNKYNLLSDLQGQTEYNILRIIDKI